VLETWISVEMKECIVDNTWDEVEGCDGEEIGGREVSFSCGWLLCSLKLGIEASYHV
jgi:hypothetical protein